MIRTKSYILFIPAIVLVVSWVGVYILRAVSLIEFAPISFHAHLYIFVFILASLIGSFAGTLSASRLLVMNRPRFSIKHVNTKANWLIFLSILSIIFTVIKIYSYLGQIPVSFADITDLRLSRGRSSSDVKGANIFGVIGNITSGFIIVSYIYSVYFSAELSKRKKRQLYLVFVLGIISSFLSGGRWTAAIAILCVILMTWMQKKLQFSSNSEAPVLLQKKKPEKKSGTFLRFMMYVVIFYVFSIIFIQRVSGSEEGMQILVRYLSTSLGGITVPYDHKEFLSEYSFLIPIYFVISIFQYYIGHAYYQFDILLSAEVPQNAPYFLAYQLYPYALLLNKFGANIITIQDILGEIVNPGVYFTLIGALYLDFGYWGSLISSFIIMYMGSYFWIRMIKQRSFVSVYICILFMVYVSASPVIGIIGTAIFPSLIGLAFVINIFAPRRLKEDN